MTPEWRKAGVCLAHGHHQNPQVAKECPLNRPGRAKKAPRVRRSTQKARKALERILPTRLMTDSDRMEVIHVQAMAAETAASHS